MKIQICNEDDSVIDGINRVSYSELNSVIDNSCEYILANNIFDNFLISEFDDILNKLIQKLRIKGVLVCSGTDIILLSKNIINESINREEASNVIASKASLNSVKDIIEKMKQKNLTIVTVKILNSNYEIFCTR